MSWDHDRRDQYSEAIDEAHPDRDDATDTDHERYGVAVEMVGNRYSKYAIVDLVNWLLKRAEEAEAKLK